MISLISNPIPYMPKKLDGDITDFNKQILMTELTKGVWDSLKILSPDYLILDFYADVYFGVRKVGNSFITDKTWLFKKTPLYSTLNLQESIRLENDKDYYFELWKKSVDIFMYKMKKEFPDIKIIINKVHFTDFYIQKNSEDLGKISETGLYKKIDVDEINRWLDIFYKYFEEHYDVEYIDYQKEYYSSESHIWDLFYVHYTQDFYDDFTTKLLSLILEDLYHMKQKKKMSSENAVNKNFIKNSTFNFGKSYWSYWQEDFKIGKPDKSCSSSNILSINCEGFEKDSNRQLWSHAVEINTKGDLVFTVSFDMKIKSPEKVDGLQFIFSLRTFDKIDHVFQKDCVWYKNIKFEDLENLESDKWMRCSYTFKPLKGKFLKVGPYLIRNGSISWRNIKLELGDRATQWIPSEKE